MAIISTLVVVILFMGLLLFSVIDYIHWKRFSDVFFSNEVLFSMRLSLITATVATGISMMMAIPTAFALSRLNFWGKDIIDTLIDIPIILSPTVIGAVLLIFFNNTIMGKFIENNVMRFTFEVRGIVLAQVAVVFSLAVRLLKSTFDGVDIRCENVARTLGANKIRAVFNITFPVAKSGIIAAFILTWSRAISEFGATLMLAGASTMKTETLPIAIFLSFAKADVYQALVIILILLGVAVFVLLAFRCITKRILL
jgi:molybdate transport system permease protein